MILTTKTSFGGKVCAWLIVVAAFVQLSAPAEAKVFKKCEVVRKLEDNGVSSTFIPTFLCLSNSESGMNSSAKTTTSTTSVSYGIFQVRAV